MEYLGFALMSVSALFFVIDPLGLLPIFLAVTANETEEKRRHTAARATQVAFGILVVFAVFGTLIFKAFGITLSAFKIAGGVLLLMTALDMLRAQPSRTRSSPEETREGYEKQDVAIIPLALPLLAGPGAIAAVMVQVSRGPGWIGTGIVVGAVGLICLVTYALLRVADRLNVFFGATGIAVLERLMGLLLAAISVQYMADGVLELLPVGLRS